METLASFDARPAPSLYPTIALSGQAKRGRASVRQSDLVQWGRWDTSLSLEQGGLQSKARAM